MHAVRNVGSWLVALSVVASVASSGAFARPTPASDVSATRISKMKVSQVGDESPLPGVTAQVQIRCTNGAKSKESVTFVNARLMSWDGEEVSLEVVKGHVFLASYEHDPEHPNLQKRSAITIGRVRWNSIELDAHVSAELVLIREGAGKALSYLFGHGRAISCEKGHIGDDVIPRLVIQLEGRSDVSPQYWPSTFLPNPLNASDFVLDGSIHPMPLWKKSTLGR